MPRNIAMGYIFLRMAVQEVNLKIEAIPLVENLSSPISVPSYIDYWKLLVWM